MANSMEITGLDSLLAKLELLGNKAVVVEKAALKAGGNVLAEAMRTNPTLKRSTLHYTHLKDDIKVSNVKDVAGFKFVSVGPSRKTSWRAVWLEFGTVKMIKRPFISEAMAASKDEVIRVITLTIKGGLGL